MNIKHNIHFYTSTTNFAQIIPAAVKKQDIRGTFSSHQIIEARDNRVPSQSTPAKPLYLGIDTQIVAIGSLCALLPRANVAIADYPHSQYI